MPSRELAPRSAFRRQLLPTPLDGQSAAMLVLDLDGFKAVNDTLGHPAGKLGLSVLAEGIENAEVWERLSSLGCDEGQVWHLARPMPSTDLLRWIFARDAADPTSVR